MLEVLPPVKDLLLRRLQRLHVKPSRRIDLLGSFGLQRAKVGFNGVDFFEEAVDEAKESLQVILVLSNKDFGKIGVLLDGSLKTRVFGKR